MTNNNILNVETVNEVEFDKLEIFHIYKLWSSIPPLMKSPPQQKNGAQPKPREFAMSMGIDDSDLLDLVEIPDHIRFSERYKVHINTLTRWKKYIKAKGLNSLPIMKAWAENMSSNMIMSMYNHAMKKGNPLMFKMWFQIINDWKETAKVEHTLNPIIEIEHEDYDPAKHSKKTEVDKVREAEISTSIS